MMPFMPLMITIARRFSLVSAYLMLTATLLTACTSWQQPEALNTDALAEQALQASVQNVQVSATVLSAADSRRFFGVDINATGVQPVWIEVNNPNPTALWLLRAGTDPDYFSPLEVAWSSHLFLGGAHNTAIDNHFNQLAFHNPIPPRSRHSGILFTNPHRGIKVLNVDIVGQQELFPFTLFLPVPDDPPDKNSQAIASRPVHRDNNLSTLDDLRAALEQLPQTAQHATNPAQAGPLNTVVIGAFADIASALVRRGFRNQHNDFDEAQLLFQRPPDFVLRKTGQAGVPANWLRVWATELHFQDQLVFIGQSARPIGGRFADPDTLQMHPDVDEARDLLIQDMMYSGGLAQLGFIDGTSIAPSADAPYFTDGLRAVLFFTTRPLTLADVELLDWLPLPQRAKTTP
jgi:hypothetical protein